jgi:hypothetical protein
MMILLTILLPLSPIKTVDISDVIATPSGERNWATVPTPSFKPAVPDPASSDTVACAPFGDKFNFLTLLPEYSATMAKLPSLAISMNLGRLNLLLVPSPFVSPVVAVPPPAILVTYLSCMFILYMECTLVSVTRAKEPSVAIQT